MKTSRRNVQFYLKSLRKPLIIFIVPQCQKLCLGSGESQGWRKNRTGTGNRGAVFQEPKPESGHPLNCAETHGQPFPFVAHHCCDPCHAAQCRARNVAANSRTFKDVAGVSRCIPLPAQEKTMFHLSCHPSVTVSRENRQPVDQVVRDPIR